MSGAASVWTTKSSKDWSGDDAARSTDTLASYQRRRRTRDEVAASWAAKRRVGYESVPRSVLVLEYKWEASVATARQEPRDVPISNLQQDSTYPKHLVGVFVAGILITVFGVFYLIVGQVFFAGKTNSVAWAILAFGACSFALSVLRGEVISERFEDK